MERTKNPAVILAIYVGLTLFAVYSVLPFAWTVLNSFKLPKDAFSRVPKITGFKPTADNYADLWLNEPIEGFLIVGLGLLVVIGFLVAFALLANRFNISPGVILEV